MLRRYAAIRDSAGIVAAAAKRTAADFAERSFDHEPSFTDQMLARMKEAMHGQTVREIRWESKTLTSMAKGSEEKKYGADFLGVLSIDLPDYQVKKGFLAQAKRIPPGGALSTDECDRLKEQCEEMLACSPASFVFIYAPYEILVVPALAVLSAKTCDPRELYTCSVERFYEDHFQSYLGDRALSSPTVATLAAAREQLRAKSAIVLSASHAEPIGEGTNKTASKRGAAPSRKRSPAKSRK